MARIAGDGGLIVKAYVLEGGFDPGKPDDDPDLLAVPVPPGRYALDVYAYLNGPNGPRCLDDAALQGSPLDWFRQSCPERPVPGWFAERFEDWWPEDEELPEDDEDPALVDYVVHLRVLDRPPPSEAPQLHRGWLPQGIGARIPARCPGGIPADSATR